MMKEPGDLLLLVEDEEGPCGKKDSSLEVAEGGTGLFRMNIISSNGGGVVALESLVG
jgi:hypothetical protein